MVEENENYKKQMEEIAKEKTLVLKETLKGMAKRFSVSEEHLSRIFKKETGKTLSEYVCTRRMDYAEYLLNTTNLQIQTVALHCGIMDVQYFSKLFKKYKGVSPIQFRNKNIDKNN